jgi:hypothetical protein
LLNFLSFAVQVRVSTARISESLWRSLLTLLYPLGKNR